MLNSEPLESILVTSGPKARNAQIRVRGVHSVEFWIQGKKMLKSELQETILPSSGLKARERSNRSAWDPQTKSELLEHKTAKKEHQPEP